MCWTVGLSTAQVKSPSWCLLQRTTTCQATVVVFCRAVEKGFMLAVTHSYHCALATAVAPAHCFDANIQHCPIAVVALNAGKSSKKPLVHYAYGALKLVLEMISD